VTAGKANQDDSDEEWGIWSAGGKKEGAEGEDAKKAQEPPPFTRILLKGTGKGKGNGGGNRGRRRSRDHGRHKDQRRDRDKAALKDASLTVSACMSGRKPPR